MLLRLTYLGVTNAPTMLRLLRTSDRNKDAEILALRHQITILQRQPGEQRPLFQPSDRAFLAALLHRLPRHVLRGLQMLVRPDTVLRWHRDLLARHHATRSRPKRPGRPRTVHTIRILVLRLPRENPNTGTPQGGILSPLLANIALSALDEHVMAPWKPDGTMGTLYRRHARRGKGLPTWRIVRYADDFVVLVHGSRDDVENLREDIAEVLAPLGLRLSQAKTRVVHIRARSPVV
ncbi:reverse transcriptase (RNA-dependent DNA polymerase) [Micromonospora pisi]|uniref:Reverse transcriptase (RNA-dependent DNA polymerase) n=1 Tax=Micromonospora pisi TaxID=589240 RepID=A0A495JUI6_9ACTN|nr:reverse transcriptase/maturase family protein [Micromonospora pisi]RKR91789.1 reverse transcriptase (RNA-dependent DNA polymerase) [Micromonospora pisi]